jgi:Protein of unknown function (DUF2917)
MNAQSNRSLLRLAAGEALLLGRLGGELTVVDGRVWLTRDGDLGDHIVEPGERLRVGVGENAVIEAARTGAAITVRWQPRRQRFVGALLAEPLRGLAFLAGRAAAGFAALARNAAASASRAQGCISGGDSIASSGALK